jgi:hypothetical protein
VTRTAMGKIVRLAPVASALVSASPMRKECCLLSNGYVVDLIVIELRIVMRENVAEPNDVASVRNRFRNSWRHSVKMLMASPRTSSTRSTAALVFSSARYCSRLNPDVKRDRAAS